MKDHPGLREVQDLTKDPQDRRASRTTDQALVLQADRRAQSLDPLGPIDPHLPDPDLAQGPHRAAKAARDHPLEDQAGRTAEGENICQREGKPKRFTPPLALELHKLTL